MPKFPVPLGINFAKLFKDKHGQKIFNEIVLAIKDEKVGECNNNYINAVFKVAFMSYFGISNTALEKMIKDMNYNCDIRETHKNSINTIKEYIEKTNN